MGKDASEEVMFKQRSRIVKAEARTFQAEGNILEFWQVTRRLVFLEYNDKGRWQEMSQDRQLEHMEGCVPTVALDILL